VARQLNCTPLASSSKRAFPGQWRGLHKGFGSKEPLFQTRLHRPDQNHARQVDAARFACHRSIELAATWCPSAV
jgi:hypothetical protein